LPAVPNPFCVLSLPRSRSTWLSALLSQGGLVCGHDIGVECETPEDFISRLWAQGGTVETGAAFAWPLIRQEIPGIKLAVVWRSPAQVIRSLEAQGIGDTNVEIMTRAQDLLMLAKEPGVLFVDQAAIGTFEGCDALHKFCTGKPLSYAWWQKMEHTNVQIDLAWQLSRVAENRDRIEVLKAEVRRRVESIRDQH
jgi:hypothetical protein